MDRRLFLLSGLASLESSVPARAQSPLDAQAILSASDRIRLPNGSFRLTNTLTEYVAGAARDSITLAIFAALDAATGQFNTLVKYAAPPRDAGKAALYNGSNLWFYDPASKATVRISPQQRLLGQAANGDVVVANLAVDYSSTIAASETLTDADHVVRTCWRCDLKARTPSALYARVEIWIEHNTNHTIKAKFYADSGRLLKTAYYRAFKAALGALRPTQTIIIDGVDTRLVTTMETAEYIAQAIPRTWFSREFLPRIPA